METRTFWRLLALLLALAVVGTSAAPLSTGSSDAAAPELSLARRQGKPNGSRCEQGGSECASGCCFLQTCFMSVLCALRGIGDRVSRPGDSTVAVKLGAAATTPSATTAISSPTPAAAPAPPPSPGPPPPPPPPSPPAPTSGAIGASCTASTTSQCASGCCYRAACSVATVCFGGGSPPAASPPPPPPPPPAAAWTPNYLLRMCRDPRHALLTLDDGPLPPYTAQVLDILRNRGVRATFFVVGGQLDRPESRDLLRRAFDEGHCIGDHTMSHADLTLISDDRRRFEILTTADRIQAITGRYPRFFRFPQGNFDQGLLDMLASMGFASVGWNVDTMDWRGDGAYIDRVRNDLSVPQPWGYTIITHDVRETAPWIVNQIIDIIAQRGMRLVSAEECYGIPCFR
ncbi:hypothetical protein DFJ74DRAFT_678947 [Hyaloraphidium curvatum]|nr:hypothetical protein DFJ74DRAFT_678947 [Hyaloraphidium curvatum]